MSIILPAKNEARYIGLCLSSLLGLDYSKQHIEVIVVDNDSNDGTYDIAVGYMDRFKPYGRYAVIRSSSKTIAGVRMDGYKLATGDIIAFLDSDSVVPADWITNALTILKGDEKVSCVGFAVKPPVPTANWVETGVYLLNIRNRWIGNNEVDWLPTFNLLIKREYFDMVSGFNTGLETCEDSDLGQKLAKISKLIYSKECYVEHLDVTKTISEFFRKELWRGKSNLAQFIKSTNKKREYKSVLAPLIYVALVMIMMILCTLYAAYIKAIACIALILVIMPVILTLRLNIFNAKIFCKMYLLVTLYLTARGVAMLAYMYRKMIPGVTYE